jgi:hypothetical protein
MRRFSPNSVLPQSMFDTSRNTRGPESYRIERQAVARQGPLGLGAADQIISVVAIEIGTRLRHKLLQF